MPGTAMDEIDRRLLGLLREDASRPLKTLAAEVGLARSSVRDRIARLQATGVIRRYTIEIRPERGDVAAMLMLRLVRTPDPAVVQAIVAEPQVRRCQSLSGDIDLLVELAAPDVEALNALRDRIATLPGVADATTAFILKHDKDLPTPGHPTL